MEKMILSSMASYFYKWRDTLDGINFGVQHNMKARIINLYHLKLRTAFDTWKKGKLDKEIKMEQGVMMEMEMEEGELQG